MAYVTKIEVCLCPLTTLLCGHISRKLGHNLIKQSGGELTNPYRNCLTQAVQSNMVYLLREVFMGSSSIAARRINANRYTSMKPIDRSCAEHYIWGDVCDGWHLVKRTDMSVIAERVPPDAKEIRHFHSTARQFFFILRGCAVIEMNGERVTLQEGQGLEVAPGVSHQFMNESPEDVHFLVVSHPSTRGDRVEV